MFMHEPRRQAGSDTALDPRPVDQPHDCMAQNSFILRSPARIIYSAFVQSLFFIFPTP
jgi:hypothetical protein